MSKLMSEDVKKVQFDLARKYKEICTKTEKALIEQGVNLDKVDMKKGVLIPISSLNTCSEKDLLISKRRIL